MFFKVHKETQASGSRGSLRDLIMRNTWEIVDTGICPALTIWLTRNWTPTELIARAIELENLGVTSVVPE